MVSRWLIRLGFRIRVSIVFDTTYTGGVSDPYRRLTFPSRIICEACRLERSWSLLLQAGILLGFRAFTLL